MINLATLHLAISPMRFCQCEKGQNFAQAALHRDNCSAVFASASNKISIRSFVKGKISNFRLSNFNFGQVS